MTYQWQKEICLLGHPLKITLPGKSGQEYKPHHKGLPPLKEGETYDGFCMDEDREFFSWRNIYLQIDNRIISISDYSIDIDGINIIWTQREFTADRLYEILIMFNKKLDDLQEQIYSKSDRD